MMKIQSKCTRFLAVFLAASALLSAGVESEQEIVPSDNQEEEFVPNENREVPREQRLAELQDRNMKIAKAEKSKKMDHECAFGIEMAAIGTNISVTNHPGAYHNYMGLYFSVLGDYITLEDGSGWTVKPKDSYICRTWFGTDLLVITPNANSFWGYDYCITNQNTKDVIEVNFFTGQSVQVVPGYTRWIVYVDWLQDLVVLNDSTVWKMNFFDSIVVKKWKAGDIAIIGINDGWNSSSYPNVLINAQTNQWASGVVKSLQ